MTQSRLQAYLELFRLPNVFTAMADVLLGFLFTHRDLNPWPVFLLLLAASSSLYTAGMVLNDYFDRDVDARERPNRPIPSGRITASQAAGLGCGLLLLGAACGWGATIVSGQVRSGLVATSLAVAIVLYDGPAKHTPLAPVAMGVCRLLNVLMGMSAAPGPWHPVHWLVAGGVAVYITGVTWFARTEARTSSRPQLAMATVVMLSGVWLLAWFPAWTTADLESVTVPQNALARQPPVENEGVVGGRLGLRLAPRWMLFWVVTALLVAWRPIRAIADPIPVRVQVAVKHCILSLIVLDAAVCWAVRGTVWAVVILALLIPAMFLGRWIYST